MRADQLLVERGMAASRSQAVRLISGGMRWRDAGSDMPWREVIKNRDDLPESAELKLTDASESRYVSRGGLKLEGALKVTGLDVTGLMCLDVGQSTGGFTDCLLQHGAAHVVGVDVGHGQLHARLRDDVRVSAIESVNARTLNVEQLIAATATDTDVEGVFDAVSEPTFDLVVADLSFISLTLVLPALVPFLAPEGRMLMLVKPQFELQPGQVGKGGIVRDAAMYDIVEHRLRDTCATLDLRVVQWLDSPIEGGDGNHEFFIHAVHSGVVKSTSGVSRAPATEL